MTMYLTVNTLMQEMEHAEAPTCILTEFGHCVDYMHLCTSCIQYVVVL